MPFGKCTKYNCLNHDLRIVMRMIFYTCDREIPGSWKSWFRQNSINLKMHDIAHTPRFVIRNFKPEEEEHFMSLFDDDQVTLHLPKRSRKENLDIFKKALSDYAANKSLGRWGLFNNTDGEFIGMCLLRNYDDEDGKIELGYVLTRKYWG